MKGFIYNKETGVFEMSIVASSEDLVFDQLLGREETHAVFIGEADLTSDYMHKGKIAKRPVMNLSITPNKTRKSVNGIATDITLSPREILRIDNVPKGVTINHPAGSDVINDGYIEWSSREAGRYFLALSKPPYVEIFIHAIVE